MEKKIADGLVLMKRPLDEEQQRYYNVATGASITGMARSLLWRGLCSSVRPYYCDTDSIACDGFREKVGKDIGEWKIEGPQNGQGYWKRGAFAGKKLYALHDGVTRWGQFDPKTGEPIGWKLATKGVSPREFGGPNVFKVANGETVEHLKPSPSISLKGGIKFTRRSIKKTVQ
jgi:hypothetical protein